MAHLAILVIFYANVIICQIFKLITWYPNMVQYTFNFHKGKISFKLLLNMFLLFEYTSTLHFFPQIYSNFPFYKVK
jgi:hypothetical protein